MGYSVVRGEGILLIEQDILHLVRAPSTGRLLALRVKQGDRVDPSSIIGEISQDELRDRILESESRLIDLRRQDTELAQVEEKERKNKESAIAHLKQDIDRAQTDLSAKMKISQREAELQRDQTNAETSRRRAGSSAGLKIRELERRLTLDREASTRKSRVVSRSYGEVAELLAARDELVKEGEPVVLLHAPKGRVGSVIPVWHMMSSSLFPRARESESWWAIQSR